MIKHENSLDATVISNGMSGHMTLITAFFSKSSTLFPVTENRSKWRGE